MTTPLHCPFCGSEVTEEPRYREYGDGSLEQYEFACSACSGRFALPAFEWHDWQKIKEWEQDMARTQEKSVPI